MKRIHFLLIIILLLMILLNILSRKQQNKKVDIKINRFEKALFSINEGNVAFEVVNWKNNFGTFPEVFATQIILRTQLNDEQYYNELLSFTHQKDMREAYDSTALLFKDFTDIEEVLEFAFGQFAVDFPSYLTPEITTFFGGFNYGVVTYDNNVAIGLENFLGQNSKFYKYLSDPEYIRFQKQRKFIASNVMEVWFNEHFQKFLGGRDLLSQIIHKGKVMYFIDKMLNDIPMEDKFRFTKNQMDWVIENEASIWEYLVHENLLFSKKENEFRTFLNYAPFAKGMPNEAPGRVAYYTGYRMVCEYMENNNLDIEELMCLTDSRKFLHQSKYKPTK